MYCVSSRSEVGSTLEERSTTQEVCNVPACYQRPDDLVAESRTDIIWSSLEKPPSSKVANAQLRHRESEEFPRVAVSATAQAWQATGARHRDTVLGFSGVEDFTLHQ